MSIEEENKVKLARWFEIELQMAIKNKVNFSGSGEALWNSNSNTQSNTFHINNIQGVMAKNYEREPIKTFLKKTLRIRSL